MKFISEENKFHQYNKDEFEYVVRDEKLSDTCIFSYRPINGLRG